MNRLAQFQPWFAQARRRRAPAVRRAFSALACGALLLIVCASGLLCGSFATAQVPDAARVTPPVAQSAAKPANASDTASATAPAPDTIGVIEGAAIAVSGPMSVEVVHGQVKTVLRSGSDVRVKSGSADVALVEGGVIHICGPAHLSILKAAGALTVALDSGTVHLHIPYNILLTMYTAQIKAQPIAIGEAPQDLLVGFDNPGSMCIRATRGAVRIEQQLTGQSVVIPQTGDVLLLNGQLESLRTSSGLCKCEVQINDAPAPAESAQSEPAAQVSKLATAEDLRKKTFDAKPELPAAPTAEKLAADEGPIYHVIEPPLVYLANAKVQPEYDASMIILVRRVRVRPTVIFQGRVLDEPVVAASVVSPALVSHAAPRATAAQAAAKPPASPTLTDRMKSFMQKIWPPTP